MDGREVRWCELVQVVCRYGGGDGVDGNCCSDGGDDSDSNADGREHTDILNELPFFSVFRRATGSQEWASVV